MIHQAVRAGFITSKLRRVGVRDQTTCKKDSELAIAGMTTSTGKEDHVEPRLSTQRSVSCNSSKALQHRSCMSTQLHESQSKPGQIMLVTLTLFEAFSPAKGVGSVLDSGAS